MNNTTISTITANNALINNYMRSINFFLSCTGLLSNLLLIIALLSVGRRQCATYFLLLLMTACDLLYCTVYISIMLTLDHYINIINHQILCPLSFILLPFTFTGSTLLLLVCLLHFLTNYTRKYDTVLGQVGGRLSVVFILAFLIVRSVFSSTSIELITPDPDIPHIQYCTIDMNTSTIVATVQKINHIFAEVTDIFVYMGWIIILLIYFINLIRCKQSISYHQSDPSSSPMVKPLSFASLLAVNTNLNTTTNNNNDDAQSAVTFESTDLLRQNNEANGPTTTTITNKQRHKDASLIILIISFISIIFYFPIMLNKYSTMRSFYQEKALFNDDQLYLVLLAQHTAHLFCLSIRFIPYLLFDKRLHVCLNRMIGMKCMKVESRKSLSRSRRKYKSKQKYIWQCQCHRRQQMAELSNNNEEGEQIYQETTFTRG